MFFDIPAPAPTTEIVITSDYVRDGLSLTNGNAALGGAVQLDASVFYAKAGATLAKFDNVADADAELSATVGAKKTFGDYTVDLSATYNNYRGAEVGFDNDEFTYRLDVARAWGPVTTNVAFQYTDNAVGLVGEEKIASAGLAFPVGFGAVASGGAGRVWTDLGDYTTWNVGVTKNITETVALDVRYFDNDTNLQGRGVDYGDRFAVSLRTSF